MDVTISQALDKTHPSYGCKNAVFQFAMTAPGGRVVRFLLVEANNPYAVICLERVLMMDGGLVSPNCRIICVLRDCTSVGTRDDLMNEVSYIDFMQDIVRPELILNDTVTSSCFSQSLSGEERTYARKKSAELGQPLDESNPFMDESNPFMSPPSAQSLVPVTISSTRSPDEIKKLEASLCGLGFRKGEVNKFIEGLDSSSNKKTLPELIREGITTLSA